MKYDCHLNSYRMTAENKEDERFLEFLNDAIKNKSGKENGYRHPALIIATTIGKDNGKEYIDFEISSFDFKIDDTIKLELIVDNDGRNSVKPVTSNIYITPSKKAH